VVNLSALLEGVLETSPQEQPSLSGDGFRYLLTYRQGAPGINNFDIRVGSLIAGQVSAGTFTFSQADAPVTVQTSAEEDRQPAIASRADGGGASGLGFGAWTCVATSTNLNLSGFLFQTASQPSIQTVETGCGVLIQEPVLTLNGLLQPGSNLELELGLGLGGTSGTGLLQFGTPFNLPLCPGQATCALGVGEVFLSFGGTSALLQIPSKIRMVGSSFAIQGIVVGITSGTACGPPIFPVAFRVSDTKIVTIG
jgi:hypothetical protein